VYLYRPIDQYGQVIDVLVSPKRDLATTRRFFTRADAQSETAALGTGDQCRHAFIRNFRRGHYELGLFRSFT
jgi:transposase-like protein